MNFIVDSQEANALKAMILKRAQEKAQTYTDDVQSDIMDIARESFVSKDNPFSQIASQGEPPVKAEAASETGIGFPQREAKLPQISRQSKTVNEQIASSAIKNNMLEARNTLSNKQSFMGALNFLNTQAAVSLIRTRADKFEIIA